MIRLFSLPLKKDTNCLAIRYFAAVIGASFGDTRAGPQPKMQECSARGVKVLVNCSQVHFSDEPRGVDGVMQLELNNSAVCLSVSPEMNKFQVLRDLRENYPCSDCELSLCNEEVSLSVVPVSLKGSDTYPFSIS